jgi:hypothetical protein
MLSSPVYVYTEPRSAEPHPRQPISRARLSFFAFCPSQPSNLQMRFLHPERFCGTFQRANALSASRTQLRDDPASISHRITSLAAPHPLTPIESHPYKNHREAGVLPTFQRSNVLTRNDPSFPFKGLRTLSFYVSRNSFVCHSYENTRGVYQLFPLWNSAPQSPRGNPRSRSDRNVPTFQRSTCNGLVALPCRPPTGVVHFGPS